MVGASDGGGPKGTATTDREKISDGQTTGAAAVSPVRADEEENTERRPPVDPKLVALAAEVPDDSMPAALASDDASAVSRPSAGLTSVPVLGVPGIVAIREMSDDDDPGEATKVQPHLPDIHAADSPPPAGERSSPVPAAGRRTGEGVAALASSTADEDAYTGDESITRHAPPVAPFGDESITADAPVTRPRPLTSNDDTESVTTRGPSRGASKVASARSVPSDDDSVATEIAVSPIATTLRVHPSGEHVRAGVPVASGAVRQRERAPDLAPHAPVRIPDGGGSAAYASDRPADDADEGPPPRYAVLVAVVAFLSLAIPVGLFLYLHDGRAGEPPAPAEVVADPVRRGDPPRAKMTKGAPSPGASGELRRP